MVLDPSSVANSVGSLVRGEGYQPFSTPTSVGSINNNAYGDMPRSSDYYVNNSSYQANAFERFGDWWTGRDRNADYQSAQQLANMRYQDAYNEWLAKREDSQYQRMVEDLKKAGLNPWLAVQNGFTASQSSAVSAAKTSSIKFDKKASAADIFKSLLSTALKVGLFMALV